MIAGVDWGSANPTCAIFIGRDGNDAQIIGEYWSDTPGRTTADDVANIDAMGRMYGVSRYLLDPAADGAEKEMRRRGMPVRNADNSVNAGIAEVQRRISTRALKMVAGSAPNMERELGTYAWDVAKSARLGRDVPIKENDHAMDSLRYGVMGLRSGRPAGGWRHGVA